LKAAQALVACACVLPLGHKLPSGLASTAALITEAELRLHFDQRRWLPVDAHILSAADTRVCSGFGCRVLLQRGMGAYGRAAGATLVGLFSRLIGE